MPITAAESAQAWAEQALRAQAAEERATKAEAKIVELEEIIKKLIPKPKEKK